MKFSTTNLLLFLAVAAMSFVACKKDASPEELLTGEACWAQVKSEIYNDAISQWENDPIEACSIDDCTKFNSDKTLAFDEGATKCDPNDPQTSVGSWSLSADGQVLTISQDGISLPFTVTELSSSKMVLEVSLFGKNRITFESK